MQQLLLFGATFLPFDADNDVDGEAFLDLLESDIKSIVPKLGLVKKILRVQKVSGSTILFVLPIL